MRKNRYLLCILLCGWMIYFAVPKLQFFNPGVEGIFAISWTLFASIVLSGNLIALLYSKSERKNYSKPQQKRQIKKKVRSFNG